MRIERREAVTRDGRAFEVRSAAPADAGAILDHQSEVHALEPRFDLPDRDEFRADVDATRTHVRRLAGAPNGMYLVAAQGRTVVGTLQVLGGRWRKVAHVGELGLSVARDWRRSGVGAVLLAAAIDAARAAPGLERLTLRVFSSNDAAIALYRAHGFAEEGRLAGHVRHPDSVDDLVLMSLAVGSG